MLFRSAYERVVAFLALGEAHTGGLSKANRMIQRVLGLAALSRCCFLEAESCFPKAEC